MAARLLAENVRLLIKAASLSGMAPKLFTITAWLHSCKVRLQGRKSARLHSCKAAWLHSCKAAWLQGCKAAWLHGCMAARLHGCLSCTAARLHGCKAAWLSELGLLQLAALLVQLSCNS